MKSIKNVVYSEVQEKHMCKRSCKVVRNNFIITIKIILLSSGTVYAQMAASRLSPKYLAEMKIKKLIEFELDSKDDTIKTVTYFYRCGKIRQRTRFYSWELLSTSDIDSNFIGSRVAFYETYIYDDLDRINFIASSWTGLREPYIMTLEHLYSSDGDTTFIKGYNHSTGESHVSKSPHLNNRDTIKIDNNKTVILNSIKDTILYKFTFKEGTKDSIVYSWDVDMSDYYYEVYDNNKLLVHRDLVFDLEDPELLISEYHIFINESGMLFKSYYYHFSRKDSFESKIIIETFWMFTSINLSV